MYKIIKIKPVGSNWEVSILPYTKDPEHSNLPHPAGFYIYNAKRITDKTAFFRLRDVMARKHQARLVEISMSCMKLLNLKCKLVDELPSEEVEK